jgi:hypothetical protein
MSKPHTRSPAPRAKAKNVFLLHVDRRELATILAALRFHQDENLQGGEPICDQVIAKIATDGGRLTPLNFGEVEQLRRRLNAVSKGS